MATFTITNSRSATEAVINNAGAITGPNASEYKFNSIQVPVPRTNLQIELAPAASTTFVTTDAIEIAFYDNIKNEHPIDGLTITKA